MGVSYNFYLHTATHTLVRVNTGQKDQMINGKWTARGRADRPPSRKRWIQPRPGYEWRELEANEAAEYLAKHLVFTPVCASPACGWRDGRRSRNRVYTFLRPALFGSIERFDKEQWDRVDMYRDCLTKMIAAQPGGDSASATEDLERQAEAGYERSQQRNSVLEGRAGFFVGATGLTSTLLLTNAGLLLKGKTFDGTSRTLAMAILAFASLAAVGAGIRALQATTIWFDRAYPDFPDTIMRRLGNRRIVDSGPERTCAGSVSTKPDPLVLERIAALLTAARRAHLIADWKAKRLDESKFCFVAVVVAMLLTTLVFVVSSQ